MSQPSTRLCAQCVRAASSRAGSALGATARGSSRLQHARQSRRCVHYAGAAQQLRHSPSVGYAPSLALDTRCAPGSGGLEKQRINSRSYATTSESVAVKEEDVEEQERKPSSEGPIPEYDARVKAGVLRDDPFQRGEFPISTFCYWGGYLAFMVMAFEEARRGRLT